jgi:hypothetical protein
MSPYHGRYGPLVSIVNLAYPDPRSQHMHEARMSFASGLPQPGYWPYVAPTILLCCSTCS